MQRQRERHQISSLMSRALKALACVTAASLRFFLRGETAVTQAMKAHVRSKSCYIYLSSSSQLQREMTKLCLFLRTRTTSAYFSYFHLELNAGVTFVA